MLELRLAGIIALCLAFGTGCQPPPEKVKEVATPEPAPPPPPPKVETPKPRPPERVSVRKQMLGTTVDGRPLECLQLGDGPEIVLFLASIHGNEPAGTPLLRSLVAHLETHHELLHGRCVLVVPEVNPDGLSRNTRGNSRKVDLNRNFPAANYSAKASHGASSLSEPESKALYRLLQDHKPTRIVSLHQPANYGAPCIDYDGPGEVLARAMAAQSDLPVKRLGAQNGSLGSFAGNSLRIPIVTVELPKGASNMSGDALWNKYGKMLLTAIGQG